MQTIDLEYNKPDFFCPFTGKQILSEEGIIYNENLAFVYIDIVGDLEYIHEDFTEIRDDIFDNPEEDEPLDTFIKRIDNSIESQLVVFNLTSYGMACGPVSCTVTIGIMLDSSEYDLDDDGNCRYCGEKCFEGECCDEQQAGGFN